MMCKYQVDEFWSHIIFVTANTSAFILMTSFGNSFTANVLRFLRSLKKKYFICALLFSKVLFNYLVSIHILLI